MRSNITYIYLVENCFGEANKVWVGKTKNSRKSNHRRVFGKQITYTIIDQVESFSRKDWGPLECYWIEQFRQWGFDIQNKNKGGGGSDFLSKSTRLKISKALKGRKVTWEGGGRPKGYKPNNGDKISKTLKNYYKTHIHVGKNKVLTYDKIKEIRIKYSNKCTRSELSREYNVSWGTIKNITDNLISY